MDSLTLEIIFSYISQKYFYLEHHSVLRIFAITLQISNSIFHASYENETHYV